MLILRLSILAAVASICACASAPQSIPSPTEHILQDGAEAQNKSLRKAWIEERHWAAPDVDWKTIEAQNGAAQIAKRNGIATDESGSQKVLASAWTEIGSRNQAGRVHAATHSPDGTKLYVGSSKAGIWRGDLNGTNWEPLGDNLYGGAHWLAVSASSTAGAPDILLAATDGGSVHYSIDDGASWLIPSGLPPGINAVRRITSATDGSGAVYMVARNYSSNQSKTRLLRSYDGGQVFTNVFNMGKVEGDAWCDRKGGSNLYAYGTTGLSLSSNHGQSWTQISVLPNQPDEVELVASEAGAPRLYAVGHSSNGLQLFRSDNGGYIWTLMTAVNDYWGSLNASTINPDLVVWGGVEAWRSTNGGSSFSRVNAWSDYYASPATKLHADIPGIDVVPSPSGGETWYVNTDGGLYSSNDGLASVTNRSLDGLRISQYYTTLTSRANPLHIAAGAQDQGYQWADQAGPAGSSIVDFEQLISGDYAHAVSGDGTHKFVYSVYPGFVLIQKGETNPSTYQANFPANESHAWLPPLAADPNHIWRFFFCAKQLYRYQKGSGNSWNPSLWSNFNFSSQFGEYLTGLTFAPTDLTRAYAVTNRGDFFFSNDHGVNWTASSTGLPNAHYFYGTAIHASNLNRDTVYVGGSGYSNAPLWRSTDGGNSFTDWSAGLPATLVYCITEAPDNSGIMFCGTETAAYMRAPNDTAWTDITGIDSPVNLYWSAEAIPSSNSIRFGTYGRGIWDFKVPASCAYASYGNGMGGANTVELSSTSSTTLGSNHVFQVSGASSSSSGFIAVGFGPASLPYSGGTVLIDPTGALTFLMGVGAGGQSAISLPTPNVPALAGFEVFLQAIIADPSQTGGLAFSNGLRGKLCL